ncbi:MAG: MarR family transcriptional regulator [Phycisphaerae bacterium]|nr:MarR family transcriptional regulator [Phycisphaerae bacterium]
MPGELEESKALFVRRWGEMGPYWGISRTMAELHALFYVSTEPLCTDDVMAQLQVSRGSASMNLRALQDWGLIRRVHKTGDRKDYFVSETDVWAMFETIAQQRKRREVEPILEVIRRCHDMVSDRPGRSKAAEDEEVRLYRERLESMLSFLETMSGLFELALDIGSDGMERLTKTLGRLLRKSS